MNPTTDPVPNNTARPQDPEQPMPEVGHRYLPTVVSVLKAEVDHDRMDCCDDDPRKVWVVVGAWSYRRAVLTHAAPFLAAAGTDDLAALEDQTFMCRLDLGNPPPFDHESGERLEWPDLRVAPPMSEVYADLGITPPEEPAVPGVTVLDSPNPTPGTEAAHGTLQQRIEATLRALNPDGGTLADLDDDNDVAVLATAVLPLFAAEREGAEAHPPIHRWYPEVLDGDHWVPYSSAKTDRAAVARLLQTGERGRPRWDDGTPVQRRLIRETTTYAVEDTDGPCVADPSQQAAGGEQA